MLPSTSDPRPAGSSARQNSLLVTSGLLLIVGSLVALVLDARRSMAAAEPDQAAPAAAGPPAPTSTPDGNFNPPPDDDSDGGRGMRPAFLEQAWTEGSSSSAAAEPRIPTRIVIPAIELDAKVVPADSRLIKYQGKYYSQWVAPNTYAAGWHTYSATLGVPGNTVLNGHHNEFGEVFRHLVDLEVGDEIVLYSDDVPFSYQVALKLILPEKNQPAEVRLANAAWIMPTQDERLTLVTCWPYETNTHRLIIVAVPPGGAGTDLAPAGPP